MGNNLRDRVAASTNGRRGPGPATGPGTDVATQDAPPPTLAEQVEQWQQEFQLAMPTGAEARQLVRDALHLMRTTKYLSECSSESVLGGLMTFAQLGLRPGVLGHGWLIPFSKRVQVNGTWGSVWEAQIVIGYKGYVQLVHQSPLVSGLSGNAVFERDTFDEELGTDPKIVHRPYRGPEGRGRVIGYYAIIRYHHGLPEGVYMTREEAIEWRNHFAMGTKRDRRTKELVLDEHGEVQGSGPWFEMTNGPEGASGFDQMAIKTCFLRAARWAPKGLDPTLARATEVDGAVRIGANPRDPDEMLRAEQVVPGDYIDAEVEDGPAPNAPPVRDVGKPAGKAAGKAAAKPAKAAPKPEDLQTEFPPVAGQGTDGPALQTQLNAVHKLFHRSGVVTTDARRHFLIGKLAGRSGPVKSASEVTKREIGQVQHYLEKWDGEGILAAQLEALNEPAELAPAADAAPQGEELPAVGTKAWHDAKHPRMASDGSGKVMRVDEVLNGDCGICEEPE
jgi:recombination protein RecT